MVPFHEDAGAEIDGVLRTLAGTRRVHWDRLPAHLPESVVKDLRQPEET
jgi:hypothetical protein